MRARLQCSRLFAWSWMVSCGCTAQGVVYGGGELSLRMQTDEGEVLFESIMPGQVEDLRQIRDAGVASGAAAVVQLPGGFAVHARPTEADGLPVDTFFSGCRGEIEGLAVLANAGGGELGLATSRGHIRMLDYRNDRGEQALSGQHRLIGMAEGDACDGWLVAPVLIEWSFDQDISRTLYGGPGGGTVGGGSAGWGS